ncbi:MAG: peptidoglycan-binding domain-containing protein [Pseudomonadota bacterium]
MFPFNVFPFKHFALTAVILGCTWAMPAAAVDITGAHRTRGVGQFSCEQFVTAKSEDEALYRSFGGWIDGFLSAVNFYEETTFDIAPWQSTDVLAEGLSAYCSKNPALPFEEALKRLVEDLGEQRLYGASKLVLLEERLEDGTDVRLPIYEVILERTQQTLKRLGYLDAPITKAFDDPTRDALRAFQERIGRPETGLPDQVTLLFLFDKGAIAYQRDIPPPE